MSNKPYILPWAHKMKKLEGIVEERISEGYKLASDLKVVYDPTRDKFVYIQPMILPRRM